MEVGDLTGLCLLAEGFPRDADPRWVAACIAQNSRISVHQLAPVESDTSASPANWILRFRSHEEQKTCLVRYRKFQVPFMNEVLQITLNIPSLALKVPPLEAWTTMDEDPNRLDSIQSSELFGSGYGDTKECPGAGPSQGLLGPGEHPPGAQYHAGEPSAQYPPFHQHPSPGYSPSMPGPGQHRGGSDPSLAGQGGGSYYPQSYQQQFPFGEGGQYHMPYNMAPGGYQHGPGMHGYAGMEQGFSEMSFDDQGYQQPGPYSEYSSGGNLDSSTMDGGDMQSDFVVLGHEGAMHQFYLRVTDLPPQVTEQELWAFFQDRRASGGGPINQVVLDPSKTAAAIHFTDTDVIQRVVQRAPHLLRDKKIKVELATENPNQGHIEETRTVEIRGIDDEESTEMCIYYFENPSKGGGDIEDSRWDDQEKVFYITFRDAAVAESVASRGHTIAKKVLEVSLYRPQPEEEEDSGPQCTVEVRGFDPAKLELYEFYFENPRKGGGPITQMTTSDDGKVMYITFESPEVAERVAALSHNVSGCDLEVTLAPKEKPISAPPATVKVTDCDLEQDELYRFYFENPIRGGGAIADFKVDEKQQAIFITFEDPEVAEAVCNRPHRIGSRDLKVSLCIPEKGAKRQKSREMPTEEEEEPPRKTVQVTGNGPLQTDDTYLYYFENPRNGGGDVEEVRIDKENEVVYVTFSQPEVAERVAKKQHKIGRTPVQVNIYVPPKPKPTYSDKLLFKNVADSTTKDCLEMYLERITGLEPKDIVYGDEPGVVLVSFDTAPDLTEVETMCRKRKLEGRQLTVSKVPITNCILVEGLHPNTTEDTVELYFENKRSKGGPVEKAEITHDGDVHRCFVYFQDHEVIDSVLTKAHKIDGKPLQVKRYMECLGLSGGSEDPNVFVFPKPIVIEDADKFKVAFIRLSAAFKSEMAQSLAENHGAIKFKDSVITVDCTLTKDIPKARIIARTWTHDTQQLITDFFGQIDVHRKEIMQQIWREVEAAVIGSDVDSRDEAIMFPLAEETALVVVGRKSAAKDLFEQISKKVNDIEAEIERKRQEITETNGKLKLYQLRLLAAMSFHSEAQKRHPGLNVDIKTRKGEVIFHGMMQDVKEAQVEMYTLLNTCASDKITEMSDMQRRLLENTETRNFIVKKLKDAGIVAVWEVNKKEVLVYAFSDAHVVKAVHIIKGSVVEHICNLSPESSQALKNPDWHDLVKTLLEGHPGTLAITPSHNGLQVYLTGTDDIMHGIKEEVTRFMDENTIYSETLAFAPNRQRFIATYWQNRVQQIVHSLKAYKVHASVREACTEFSAQGTCKGLEEFRARLQKLEEQLVVEEKTFTDQGKVKFLKSSTAEKELNVLGRSNQCVVALQADEPGLKGDITEMEVDVIVNAANNRMAHIGGLAKAIVDKGGQVIQQECDSVVKAKGGQLSEGDVLVSNPGRLPCKAVIHAVGPMYKGGFSGEEDILFDTILKCLETANSSSYASIALPAISTGIFHYPVQEATSVIVEAVKKYFESHRRQTVREVYLCDTIGDTIKQFTNAMRKHFRAAQSVSPSPLPRTLMGSQKNSSAGSHAGRGAGMATGGSAYKPIRVVIQPGEIAKVQDFLTTQSRYDGQHISGSSGSHLLARGGNSRSHRRFSEPAGAAQPVAAKQTAGGSDANAAFDIGGLRLMIKQGDITEERVDAIVNSSNSQLDLSRGAVASALRNKCGKALETECRKKVGEMQKSGIVQTSAPGIKSKIILHINAESFSNDWEEGIKLCFEEAERHGVRSLAIPAFGTGAYGLSASASARALFSTIVKFSNHRKNLDVVRVVLFDKTMIPQFISAIQSKGEKHNKGSKGVLNWFKGLAGMGTPDVVQTHSSPVVVEAKFYIYAEKKETVSAVLRQFDDVVRERFTRKEMLDDTLMYLAPEDIQRIQNAARKNDVEIEVQAIMGRLVMDGLHSNVFEAMQEVSNIIRMAERQRQDSISAAMLANMIQWCFLEVTPTGPEQKEYGKKENHIIEVAFQSKKKFAEIIDADGNAYVIDFDSMMEHPKDDPTDTVGVMRRDKMKDLAAGSLPETWAQLKSDEHIRLVRLQPSDAEYMQVEKNFRATLGGMVISRIVAIDRIQNPTLYRQYAAKKAHLERQNQGIENEKTLWHGTAIDAVDNINMYGFNRSYCGKNAVVYGQGVYFAVDSNYSSHPKYSPPDLSGNRHVYQCKVLVGHSTTGNQNLRVLPQRQGSILFDSVSDNPQNPRIYVIFNDTQAYPEFLITFQ
ncbi:hypothetical protein BaRGS_00029434 [Batillaria attramentaria]|uniref:Poly [ADP-ribose] polymerase n=1 Tax=Batillaria attramentaria TaxID=370345 RepID=A0ABD0JXN6_9CAEN